MNQVDNERITAGELVSFAQQQGFDLEPLRNESLFQGDQRWVYFWRKWDGLPCSGPADEQEGTLHYAMQGIVFGLPDCLKGSAGAFRNAWSESGTLENLEQAFEFLKAWLLENREVDDLPRRSVRRYGIS